MHLACIQTFVWDYRWTWREKLLIFPDFRYFHSCQPLLANECIHLFVFCINFSEYKAIILLLLWLAYLTIFKRNNYRWSIFDPTWKIYFYLLVYIFNPIFKNSIYLKIYTFINFEGISIKMQWLNYLCDTKNCLFSTSF